MKKKFVFIMVFYMWFIGLVFSESKAIEIVIAEFDVRVNGVLIDTQHSQYPLITYQDITYLPMTYDYLDGIGLGLDFSSEEGLKVYKQAVKGPLNQRFLGANNVLGDIKSAGFPSFPIEVNGIKIDNGAERYPILLYKDITYFPMTWRFAVDEFGWQTQWSAETGFDIIIEKELKVAPIDGQTNDLAIDPAYTRVEFESGNLYVGAIENAMFNGYGEYYWVNGDMYIGYWLNDYFHGPGILDLISGDVYKGNWKLSKKDGLGEMTWHDGESYDGAWLNDTIHGLGTYYYANGDRYQGMFNNFVREGYGTYYWADGDYFQGLWQDNLRNGQGKYTNVDGTFIIGTWLDDIYVED